MVDKIDKKNIGMVRPLSRMKKYDLKDFYYANDKGNVFKLVKKENKENYYIKMRPFVQRDGYIEYVLTRNDGTKQHIQEQIISATLFIPNPKNLPHVNHRDGDRTNNYYKNLNWSTISDNIKHSYRKLGRKAWNKGKVK